jgi:polynucleotide 5'-hydroxyl-kinase GRC3/NOL9
MLSFVEHHIIIFTIIITRKKMSDEAITAKISHESIAKNDETHVNGEEEVVTTSGDDGENMDNQQEEEQDLQQQNRGQKRIFEETILSEVEEQSIQKDHNGKIIQHQTEEAKPEHTNTTIGLATKQDDDDDDDDNKEDDKIEKEEEDDTYRPVYSLPDGMELKWNDDHMFATLHVDRKQRQQQEKQEEKAILPRVCLVGRAFVEVKQGQIQVLGHNITGTDSCCHKTPIKVTSPFWSSWMTIEILFDDDKPDTETSNDCCIIQFTCVRNRPNSFRIVAPTRPIVIPNEWKCTADTIIQQDFAVSSLPTLQTTALSRTSLDDDDDHDNNNTTHPSFEHPRQVCMITGAKGVGKSTFLRYMTNRLLNTTSKVAILDADVGQPELAPPGILRLAIVDKPLLQPPYWNLVETVNKNEGEGDGGIELSSVFFGAITSKADPTRYVDAIQLLMKHYEEHVVGRSPTAIPLLINMDGWVKGIGYQVLSALVGSLQPTLIVQILGENRAQTFDLSTVIPPEQQETLQVYPLPACSTMEEASVCHVPSLTWRNFRWATYFLPCMVDTFDAWDFVSAKDLQTGWIVATGKHFCIDSSSSSESLQEDLNDECRLAKALAKERPFCVPMEAVECFVIGSDFEDHLGGAASTEFDADTEEEKFHRQIKILQALNGGFVGLCTNVTTVEVLGCGILRSIDWKRRLLYILVPPSIHESSLSQVKALVGGNLPLPLAMLYRGVYSESFPYLTTRQQDSKSSTTAILGSNPMRSRNNIVRRGLASTAGNTKR